MNFTEADNGVRHYDNALDLSGTSVLITGGTGSFGKRLVTQILRRHAPTRLIVFSRDETKQYEQAQQIPGRYRARMRYFIGDVRDRDRLEMALRGVDYVIHAAALKHVPTAEYNPFECIRTNVIGAENIVQAAIRNNVRKVVALSTDKAVNPVNLYGASKLASDKIFVAANHLSGASGPRFSVARYGNVVGSRGSVVPLFRRLVRSGARSLPITDARMTRFWITISQGAEFVLSCLDTMRGGEIFVPKIPSMKLVDMARHIGPGLAHESVGVRPGEKLHEVLLTEDDARNTFELDDRYIIEPSIATWTGARVDPPGARRMADGFSYKSDTNSDWLDAERLDEFLADVPE